MGDLVLGEQQIVFTYTDHYHQSELAGLSLLGDQQLWDEKSVHYPVSERVPLFPRLISLVPGKNPRNLQRKQYLNILRQEMGREPPQNIETEWKLMLLGGHGGVGHIDVFQDDLAADHWYQNAGKTRSGTPANKSQIWKMAKREVLDQEIEFDPSEVDLVLGPTPTVGGMISKILVAIDKEKLEQDRELVLFRPETKGAWDVILKIEPPEYRGLLDLEALCLKLHDDAGFKNVPTFNRYDDGALKFLAVERFDRSNKKPVPMESLFSIIASGDHNFRETGDILLEELGEIFDQLSTVVELAPETKRETYKRIIMALLTGNGDLHLENLSLIGNLNGCELSPIYDPAPMRAWPRHNILSAIPFDPTNHKTHSEYFLYLGSQFSLSDRQTKNIIADLLEATEGYTEAIMELDNVPLTQREQLTDIAERERGGMRRVIQ